MARGVSPHAGASGVPVAAASRLRMFGEQALVLAGQLTAGVSHLAFAVVVARILSPADFAAFAAFQAMYLVIRALVSSLIAGGSLDPTWSLRARGRLGRVAVRLGLVTAGVSLAVGRLLHLQAPLMWLLAAAAPGAVLFALDQGRLFGLLRHGRAVAGQIAGPAARMVIGIPLAAAFGATGAGVATVVGGYVAVLVVWPRSSEREARVGHGADDRAAIGNAGPAAAPAGRSGAVPAAIVAFLLLSIVQNQDVMVANRLLAGIDSGRFAALSTLGGAIAFATATVPFVLLPRSRSGGGALGPALLVSGLLGVVPTAIVAVAATPIMTTVFGARYADAAPLATRYVLAMGFLGVARVLVAHLCSRDRWTKLTPALVAIAAVGQIVALLAFGDSVVAIATITVITTALLAGSAGLVTALDIRADRRDVGPAPLVQPAATPTIAPPRPPTIAAPTVAPSPTAPPSPPPQTSTTPTRSLPTDDGTATRPRRWTPSTAWLIASITAAGLVLRVATASRSVWVDEAISIDQATMSFGDMLADLGTGDVHPPLYSAVLWLTVRVLGTGELALRLPSIIAGTMLLPMVFAVAKTAFTRRTAVVGTILASVSPFLVWYSQEARMYGMVMLFALVALWAQLRALDEGRWWHWALYAASSAAMVWTHYFAIIPIAAQQLIFLGEWHRRRRDHTGALALFGRWFAAMAGTALLVAPLVPFLLHQLSTNQAVGGMASDDAVEQAGTAPGSSMSVYRVGANVVWALWGFHPDDAMTRIAAMWPLLMLLALFLLGRGWTRGSRCLVAMTVLPTAAFVVLGVFRDGLFEVRYFGPAVAPLLILVASWIVGSARSTATVVVATTLIASTMVVGLVDQQLNNQNPRVYDFAGAVAEVEDLVGPGDTFVYGPDYLGTVVEYYAPDLEADVVGGRVPDVGDGQRVVVLGSFLDIPSVSGELGTYLSRLEEEATLVETIHKGTEVRIWVYE